MTSSAVPGTIDALVTLIGQLPVVSQYNVQVSDGICVDQATNLVVIGGGRGNDVSGTQTYAGAAAGAPPRNESFDIELLISGFVGSADQKTARDTAYAIFSGIATFVRSNSTLGGAVTKCQISTFQVAQTTADDAAQGRNCDITVGLSCDAYYLYT
jgi:hypothetical protein